MLHLLDHALCTWRPCPEDPRSIAQVFIGLFLPVLERAGQGQRSEAAPEGEHEDKGPLQMDTM